MSTKSEKNEKYVVKENSFSRFIDNGVSLSEFSRIAGIGYTTLWYIYNGRRPSKRTAIKICKFSHGKLVLKDFGR
jgi:predicted transcriptional regulator